MAMSDIALFLIFKPVIDVFDDFVLKTDQSPLAPPPVAAVVIQRIESGYTDGHLLGKYPIQGPAHPTCGKDFCWYEDTSRTGTRRPIAQSACLFIRIRQIAAEAFDGSLGYTQFEQHLA